MRNNLHATGEKVTAPSIKVLSRMCSALENGVHNLMLNLPDTGTRQDSNAVPGALPNALPEDAVYHDPGSGIEPHAVEIAPEPATRFERSPSRAEFGIVVGHSPRVGGLVRLLADNLNLGRASDVEAGGSEKRDPNVSHDILPLGLDIAGAATNAPAHETVPFPAKQVTRRKIVAGKQVTSKAMGFGRTHRRDPITPQRILAVRHGSAMVRVAATARAVVANEMIERHPLGYRPYLSLVANTMDETYPPTNPNLAVALVVPGPLPDVATIGVGNPPRRVLPFRVPRNENASHFATRLDFRYTRIRFAPLTRRHVEQRPSGSRLSAVRRCPAAQYLYFMPVNVAHSGATVNPQMAKVA